jgi:hypothetical protein
MISLKNCQVGMKQQSITHSKITDHFPHLPLPLLYFHSGLPTWQFFSDIMVRTSLFSMQ